MSQARTTVVPSGNGPLASIRMAIKKGRPRTVRPTARRGCRWPVGDTVCGRPLASGLAVCRQHADVLDQPPGRHCAWPSCPQSGFKALCTFHDKVAHGLIEPLR